MEFDRSTSEQMEEVATLLQHSFHVQSDHPSLDRSYLNWKYYTEVPSWSGPRSFLLSAGDEIVAHAAIWPVQLRLRDGIRQGFGFGDWAASEEHRGAGLLLLKKLKTLASFILVTGGAEITRQILPRTGFEYWADRPIYARVLRPVRQTFTRGASANWKEPLRLARNVLWSRSATAPVRDWAAEIAVPDGRALALVQGQTGSVHTPEFFRFILSCPTVRFQYLALRDKGELKGYCVLSFVGGQARIADIRIASEDEADWSAAVAAVLHVIRTNKHCCEVMAVGSVAKLDNALAANGFRVRGSLPLVVFDSEKRMAQEPLPQLGMLEDDASFLNDPVSPYFT